MMDRYIGVDQVNYYSGLTSYKNFTDKGFCEWCNKPLPKGFRRFCPRTGDDNWPWRESQCLVGFYHYWYKVSAFKRAIFIRDNFTCQRLACSLHPMRADKPWLPDLSQLHCDHIIPLSRGGMDAMDNLQTLCASCNLHKSSRTEAEFAQVNRTIDAKRRQIVMEFKQE